MEKLADKNTDKKKHAITDSNDDAKSISVSLKTIHTDTASSNRKNAKKKTETSSKKKPTSKSDNGSAKKTDTKKNDTKKTYGKSQSSTTNKKTTSATHNSTKKTQGDLPLSERIKRQLKENYLLWITVVIIAIPLMILIYILVGSRGESTSPVVGSRFDDALDPQITEQDLAALKDALQFDDAQAVEINLKSATLRITIDTRDDMSQEEIAALVVSVYDKVAEKLPVQTYFTNKKNGTGEDAPMIKMYDLEISAYNFIPENEEQKANQIYLVRSKNAAAEDVIDDVLTTARDEQSAEEILHPDISEPPVSEENTEGE